MNRIERIRKEEKLYHDFCYDNYQLFERGSWLYKPVKTVMEILPLLKHKNIHVLDLGSGVGRNSIPIAEKVKANGGKVVCVDFLDSAIEKLQAYSERYLVEDVIEAEKCDIETFEIKADEYDLIVAVSSLEHVRSEDVLTNVLTKIREGTKPGGIICLIINSEVKEVEIETDKQLDAQMEINVPTTKMLDKLNTIYKGWELRKQVVKPLTYEIVRNEKAVLLTTNAITYVAQKR